MEHANDTNASLDLLVEDHMTDVREPVISGANVLDAAPHVGHLCELRKAAREEGIRRLAARRTGDANRRRFRSDPDQRRR